MAGIASTDLRRTDLRGTSLENPYWVTSAELTKADDTKGALLFDFPLTGGNTNSRGLTIIEAICFEVTTLWAGGNITIDIGLGTIADGDYAADDDIEATDLDKYIPTADITYGTVGTYFPDGGDYVTELAAMTFGSPVVIAHLDALIPVIYATITTDTTITGGAGRVHALLNRVPLLT